MQRQFLRNIIFVVGINLIIKPFYIFGIDRSVQNEVGPEVYGLYFAVLNLTYLFQILSDFGLQNYNHSVFSKHAQLIPKYLPKILGVKLLLGLLFMVTTILVGWLMGYKAILYPLFVFVVINQFLASILAFLRTSLSARGHYALDSLLSVLDKIVMIVIVGFLLWSSFAPTFKLINFVWAQTFSFAFATLVASILLISKGQVPLAKVNIDIRFAKWVLRKSIPFAMVLLFMTLYTRMDAVMIERMLPDGAMEAGIYAASYRILDAFNMVGLLFAGLLLPMLAKNISLPNALKELVGMSSALLWVMSITVVSISFFYGHDIITLLYRDSTLYWSSIYKVLMLAYLAVSMSYVYGTLLTAQEAIGAMNRIFIVGIALNFVLNLVLIQQHQAWGAAVATVITQSIIAMALWLTAVRKGVGIHTNILVRRAALACLCMLVTYMTVPLAIFWPIKIVAVGVFTCIMAFVINVLSLSDLTRFLKTRSSRQ